MSFPGGRINLPACSLSGNGTQGKMSLCFMNWENEEKQRKEENAAYEIWNRELKYLQKRTFDKRKVVGETYVANQVVSLSNALQQWVSIGSRPQKLAEAQLRIDWEKIVGSQIAAHTRIRNIDRGKLYLSVDQSSWRHQLFYLKSEIIEKINQHVKHSLVREIIFTGG